MKILLILVLNFYFLYSNNYHEIETKILNFQFQAADSLIKRMPNSPHKFYFLHHNAFYQQFFYENYHVERFFTQSDSFILKMKSVKGDEEWKIIFLGEIYLERTIIHYLQKSYWSAYKNFKESYKICQKTKHFKNIFFSKRLEALLEIFLGSIPSKYQWITNWLGYYGKLEKGIQIFYQILSKTEILKEENQVLLFYFSKHLLNNSEEAFQTILKLHKQSPNNLFFVYLMGINYLDRKELQKAKQNFNHLVRNPIKNFDYPYYHLAHCYLYELKLDSAQYFLEKFIEKKRGNIFKADANYKMGVILSLKNQKTDAQKYFYRAIQFDEEISDKDLHAIQISKNLIFKSLTKEELMLYQARWLFDGGHYNESLNILNKLSNYVKNDVLIEIIYRKARVYHELKNYPKAIDFYKKVFDISTSKNLWMKPYSAYYLALIYEIQKDFKNSHYYLNEALSYNHYDFQASLEQKVKTKLSHLFK